MRNAFIDAVELMEPSFGGINLEDIAAPECFIIEQTLRERMNIPVFHDDQHGTAIITAAGLINACYLTGRKIKDDQGRGERRRRRRDRLHRADQGDGRPPDNVIMCDRKGVIYQGRRRPRPVEVGACRRDRQAHARRGAGRRRRVPRPLAPPDALTPEMVKSMAPKPIIFAMANPDPEITPAATPRRRGPTRSSPPAARTIPNQVNNVLGFPFIFRGALDVRATTINDEMKIAAAERWPSSPASRCPRKSPRPMADARTVSAATTSSRRRSIRG